jgi:hypothetical protein
LDVHGSIPSAARLARRAIVAANLPGDWIDRKCRLAKVTIASGFGAHMNRGYGGLRKGYKVLLPPDVAYLSTVWRTRLSGLFIGLASGFWRPRRHTAQVQGVAFKRRRLFAVRRARCLFAIGTREEL